MGEWVIPEEQDSDSGEVRAALERARQAWEREAHAETLGWLRRAAGVAAQEDDDMRAIQLFIAAAEVAEVMSQRERAPSRVQRTGPRPRPWEEDAAEEEADSVKQTVETPRTKLRRAIMAIDPEYAQRVDLDMAGPGRSGPLARAMQTASTTSPAIAFLGDEPEDEDDDDDDDSWSSWNGRRAARDTIDDDEEERQDDHRRAERRSSVSEAPRLTGALPVYRVNLVPIPDEQDVRLLFVSAATPAPRGLASALLVPQSEEDAELLRAIYDGCDAKV